MGLPLSPGFSVPPRSHLNPPALASPDTGLGHVLIRDPPVVTAVEEECPLTTFPLKTGPYLVERRHLLCHPRVAVLVDGVKGQAAQHRTDQDHPEAHQVDVEGPAPKCMDMPRQGLMSRKTPLGDKRASCQR